MQVLADKHLQKEQAKNDRINTFGSTPEFSANHESW